MREALEQLAKDKSADVVYIDTSNKAQRCRMTEQIQKMAPELLVTYNLAGFEMCTLTDGLSYNLVDCRQFHLKENRCLPNEEYLFKEKSINMFFFGI